MASSAVPYYIIVDDKDNNVTVVGTNVTNGAGEYEEYDGTQIALNGENTQVIFSFWGTSVSEYQTMGAGEPNTLNFTVDDETPAKVGEPVVAAPGQIVPHYMIYNATSLPNGAHTLISSIETLNVVPNEGSAQMIIDYFIVTRPAGDDVTGLTLLYDDAHPAFQYTGQWNEVIGPANAVSGGTNTFLNMNWTLHGATSEGATAQFNFNGSAIAIYGNIREGTTGSIASFSLDSEPATTASVPIPVPSPLLNVTANQLLYQNTTLVPGTHSLLMTALGSNIFYFDYITVTGISNAESTAIAHPSPSGSGAATTSGGGGSGGGSGGGGSTAPASSQSPTSHHATPVGTIVGAVVGVVVGVGIIVGIFLFFFYRKRRSEGPILSQQPTGSLYAGPGMASPPMNSPQTMYQSQYQSPVFPGPQNSFSAGHATTPSQTEQSWTTPSMGTQSPVLPSNTSDVVGGPPAYSASDSGSRGGVEPSPNQRVSAISRKGR